MLWHNKKHKGIELPRNLRRSFLNVSSPPAVMVGNKKALAMRGRKSSFC